VLLFSRPQLTDGLAAGLHSGGPAEVPSAKRERSGVGGVLNPALCSASKQGFCLALQRVAAGPPGIPADRRADIIRPPQNISCRKGSTASTTGISQPGRASVDQFGGVLAETAAVSRVLGALSDVGCPLPMLAVVSEDAPQAALAMATDQASLPALSHFPDRSRAAGIDPPGGGCAAAVLPGDLGEGSPGLFLDGRRFVSS